MIYVCYFLLFLFIISFTQTFFSFFYGTFSSEHGFKFLTKQTISIVAHFLLLIPLFPLFLLCTTVPKQMLITICSHSLATIIFMVTLFYFHKYIVTPMKH